MYPDLRITQSTPRRAVIDIEGTIGADLEPVASPQAPVSTYRRFREKLDRLAALRASEVVVNIRSTGGSLADAFLIFEALCNLDAQVTTRCWGYTASAATVIAQAASPRCREISANCLYLIHCSESAAEGNHADFERSLDLLRQTDRRVAQLYAARSGRPADQFMTIMARGGGRGCWLSPEETLQAGLADRIIRSENNTSNKLKFSDGSSGTAACSGLHGEPPDRPSLPRVGFFRRYVANLRAALHHRLAESLHAPLRYTPVEQIDTPAGPETDTTDAMDTVRRAAMGTDVPNLTDTVTPDADMLASTVPEPAVPDSCAPTSAASDPTLPVTGVPEPSVPDPDACPAASGSTGISGVAVQGYAGDPETAAESVRSTVRATATRCKEDPSPADDPHTTPNQDAYRADASRLRTSI